MKDGGPAFPALIPLAYIKCDNCKRLTQVDDDGHDAGMSLRDWFAGQAMLGILGNSHVTAQIQELKRVALEGGVDVHEFERDVEQPAAARAAYMYADAMLAEREKR